VLREGEENPQGVVSLFGKLHIRLKRSYIDHRNCQRIFSSDFLGAV
jgi:hypothetical protein